MSKKNYILITGLGLLGSLIVYCIEEYSFLLNLVQYRLALRCTLYLLAVLFIQLFYATKTNINGLKLGLMGVGFIGIANFGYQLYNVIKFNRGLGNFGETLFFILVGFLFSLISGTIIYEIKKNNATQC